MQINTIKIYIKIVSLSNLYSGGGVNRILVGKPEGKRPLRRPRRKWVDSIKMDLQEVGCGYMDWIGLGQDSDSWRRLVSAVMNLRVPWNAGNFLTSCKPVGFSRRTLHHGVSKYVYSYVFRHLCIIIRELTTYALLCYIRCIKNLCNLAREWLETVWWWHKNVEACRNIDYTDCFDIYFYDINCAFLGYKKNFRHISFHEWFKTRCLSP